MVPSSLREGVGGPVGVEHFRLPVSTPRWVHQKEDGLRTQPVYGSRPLGQLRSLGKPGQHCGVLGAN
jgi:hypothetical protein